MSWVRPFLFPEAKIWLLSIPYLEEVISRNIAWHIIQANITLPVIVHQHCNFSLNMILFCSLAEKLILSKVNFSRLSLHLFYVTVSLLGAAGFFYLFVGVFYVCGLVFFSDWYFPLFQPNLLRLKWNRWDYIKKILKSWRWLVEEPLGRYVCEGGVRRGLNNVLLNLQHWDS